MDKKFKNKICKVLLVGILSLFSVTLNSKTIFAAGTDAPSFGQIGAKFKQVVNGYTGGMALDNDGSVWSWGYNAFGHTGVDKNPTGGTVAVGNYLGGMRRIEYFANNNIKIVQISGNYHNKMALDDKGNVYTWGHGAYGEMGNGRLTASNRIPQIVPGLSNIEKIVSNSGEIMGSNFAIDKSGAIWGWGYNAYGQLGNGGKATAQKTPQKYLIPAGVKITKLVAGDRHAHALDSDGNIWSTGQNENGRLGDSQSNTIGYATPKKMPKPSGMSKITDISVGITMNVALDDNDNVWQWGMVRGRGGAGTYVPVKIPEKLQTEQSEISKIGYIPVAQKVFAGESVSYYIDQHGRSWAWGDNRYHGLGAEGAYTANLALRLSKAQQYPKIIGDGDTQVTNRDPKTPSDGAKKNSKKGYGFNTLHPTIYDEKYNDPKEDVWKELAFKPIPYVDEISAGRGAYTILDQDGNLFTWAETGSGAIGWGWDYNSAYDLNGSLAQGLYDRYSYEVMYMRDSPRMDTIKLSLNYRGEDFETGKTLAGFTIDGNNPDTVKKGVKITRTPIEKIGDNSIIGYRVDNETTINKLDKDNKFVYTPTKDATISFVYGKTGENAILSAKSFTLIKSIDLTQLTKNNLGEKAVLKALSLDENKDLSDQVTVDEKQWATLKSTRAPGKFPLTFTLVYKGKTLTQVIEVVAQLER